MKLWINFEKKHINKLKEGWTKGDDFEGQLVFEEEQDTTNCRLEFKDNIVTLHFNNGFIEMSRKTFGGLFQ